MSDRVKRALSLVLSLALGGVLLWLALRGADFAAVGEALAEGQWGWMVPFVAAALASVAARAWRWGMLVDALPGRTERTPLLLTSSSVAIGYLVNYVTPRLGEVVRMANVSRRADAPFTAVVGTVVAERVLDTVVLLLGAVSVLVLYEDRVGAIVSEAAATVGPMLAAPPTWSVVVVAVALVGLAALAVVVVRRGRGKLAGLLGQLRDGVASVGRTGRPGAMVLSTVLLWACYAAMTEFPLRILGITQAYGLTPVDAWAVMIVGGFGMALPSPGGTGSFHYATVQALTLLCAVAVTPAATFALLVHGAGLVFYAVLGAIAMAVQGTTIGSLADAAETEAERAEAHAATADA